MRLPNAAILLLAGACCALATGKSDIAWISPFERASERAATEAKPLLIEFWATWCEPCRQMDSESWSAPRVVELSRRFIAASVDVDRNKETAGRFLVNVLPTVILATPWGDVLARREGFVHPSELAALMAQVPPDFAPARDSHEALLHNPKDGSALARMGQFFAKANSPSFANQFYQEALKTDACKADPAMRCDLRLAIGMEHIVMGDWNEARKLLRQFLKEFPEAAHRDHALFGLVVADCKQRKRADAEKTLAEMKRQFPTSDRTAAAVRLLEREP